MLEAQDWLSNHYAVANPVEELVERSGLAGRTFKRRFTKRTGYPPISYVQHLRVEEAKRRLERTDEPIDKISWAVGYEDPAFFPPFVQAHYPGHAGRLQAEVTAAGLRTLGRPI